MGFSSDRCYIPTLMLGIHIAVWLALVLSVASVILCVVYGMARWNADDDCERLPPSAAPAKGKGTNEKHRQGT